MLETVKTQTWALVRAEMLKMKANLHSHSDAFHRRMQALFTYIEVPDIDGIREEVAILSIEVHSLIESHIPSIPFEIPLFSQPMPP